MISVVIPAHNEAPVIARTLRALFEGVDEQQLDVVVACNGCTDGTADVVRATGLPVRTIEVAEASKIAAIRAADAVSTGFPRIYLDADVVLPGPVLIRVARALAQGPALAGRPPLKYATGSASLPVRRYYAARSRVPELLGALWGAGVYGLSEAGHTRVTPWPDVLADDLYVDRAFDRCEIAVIGTDPVIVQVPRTSRILLRVLKRAYRGVREETRALGTDRPPVRSNRTFTRTLAGVTRLVVQNPMHLLDALVYSGFAIAARVLPRLRGGPSIGWERDESSRIGAEPVESDIMD